MKTPRFTSVAAATLAWLCPSLSATAATKTWDGQGAFERWDSGINWAGNNAPNANDDLVWPANGVLGYETDNDFPAGTQFRSLTFTSVDHGSVNGWEHNGNRVHLTHGINFYGANTTLGLPVRLTGNQTWTNGASSAQLRMVNSATLDINGRTLSVEGRLDLVDARLIGWGVVHVLAGGDLALQEAANSFSGTINVDDVLRLIEGATMTGSAQVNLVPGTSLECWPTAGISRTHTINVNMVSGSSPGEEATIRVVTLQGADVVTLAGAVTCTGLRNEGEVNGGTLALLALGGTGNLDVSLFNGGGLRIAGGTAMAPINGEVIVRSGPLEIGRSASPSFGGPLKVYNGFVTWLEAFQFGPGAPLILSNSDANLNGNPEVISSLELSEATVTTGTAALPDAGQLQVEGNLLVHQAATPSQITGQLRINANSDWTIEGPAGNTADLIHTGEIKRQNPSQSLRKLGSGWMDWSGTSTLGAVQIMEGQLSYYGTGTTMDVTLNGGSFAAKGIIRDLLTAAGGGTLTMRDANLVVRDLTLNSATTFAGVRPGIVNHPKLIATGAVELGNAVFAPEYPFGVLTLALNGVIGEESVLIRKDSAGAVSGVFKDTVGVTLAEGSLIEIPARTWRLSYAGGDGNDVSLTLVKVSASGVTHSYTPPNAGSTQWMNNTVWTPAGPVFPGAALTFGSAANFLPFNNFPANTAMESLKFTFPGHNVSGNALALRAGIETTHTSGTTIVRTPLVLAGVIQSFRTKGGGLLQIGELTSGSVDLNGNILAVYPEHSNSVVRVGDGGSATPMITGAGTVRKTGVGTAIFGRASTYTGRTTVESGTLRLEQQGAALGVAGAGNETDVYFNATLELANLGNSPVTDKIILNGGLRADAATGSASITSELLLTGQARPIEVASGMLVLGGSITGSGGITKSGPGTLYISGNTHTFSGPFVSNAGPVRILSNANRWPGSMQIFSGSLSLEGTENLTGDLVLAGGASFDVLNGPQLLNILDLNDVTVQTGANQISAPLIRVFGSGDTIWTGPLHVRTASSELRVSDTPAAGEDFIVNGPLTGAAGAELRVEGLGRAKFTGNNTLPSISLCEAVSLFTGSSPGMAVNLCGGNMGGTGTVGPVTSNLNGGRIDPGLGAGILNTGSIAWNSATTFAAELATGTPGTNYDQLNVTGAVNLGAAALLVIPSGTPSGIFTVIQNDGSDSVTGAFAGLPESAIVSNLGRSFRVSYVGGTGNDVTLTAIITGTGVTRVWDGGDTLNTNWNDPDNWVDLIPGSPAAPAVGDDLVFPPVAPDKTNTNNFAAGTTFNSIRIEGSGYTLNGNALSLNAGLIWDYASGSSAVNLAVTLAQPQTFSVLQGAQGSISGLGSVNNAGLALTVDVAAAGQLTMLNISGAGGTTRNGAGRLTMGTNSYTGATVLNAGLTSTGGISGFGSATSAIVVNAAAELQFDAVAGTFARPITLGGQLTFLNTSMTVSGAITLSGAARQVEVTGVTPSLSGIISGSGGLQKTGAGTLTLSGASANTFTGGTTVAAGTLRLQKTNQVALPGPLTVGDGAGTDILLYAAANQIGNGAAVSLFGSGAQYQCSTFSDTISALHLTGGSVTGSGTLTVGEAIQSFAATTTAVVDVPLVPSVSPFSLIAEDGTAATDLQFSGEWNGAASLVVERRGPGTVVLAGNGTTQELQLLEGLTQIVRDWSSVAVTLDGGSLGGTGPAGDVTSVAGTGGVVLPGASTDILTVTKFIANSDTVLTMEIGGVIPGTGHDVLNVRSVADPQNATLNLTLLPGFALIPGQSFTLITNDDSDAMTSEFRGLAESEMFSFSGTTASLTYKGGDGNDVVLTIHSINDTGTVRVWDGGGADANWMTAANWEDDTAPVSGDSLTFPPGAVRPVNTNNFPAGTTFQRLRLAGGYTLQGNSVFLNAGIAKDFGTAGNALISLPVILSGPQSITNLDGSTFLTFAPPGSLNTNGHLLTLTTAAPSDIIISAPVSGAGGLSVTGPGISRFLATPSFTGGVSVQNTATLELGLGKNLGTAATLTVAAGAQLQMLSATPSTVTQPITLRGVIQTNGSDHVLTGTITLPAGAAGELFSTTGSLAVNGRIQGTGSLRKSGSAMLKLQGTQANTFTGGFHLARGTVQLAKSAGVTALPGPVTSDNTSVARSIVWAAANQIADAASITFRGALDLAGFDDTMPSLSLIASTVTTGAGHLILTGGLNCIAGTQPILLTGNLTFSGAGSHLLTVANGAAAPDLQCDAVITAPAGAIIRKTGTGSASFSGACVMSDFQIAAGTVNWNAAAPGTFITMDGGTLAGSGTFNQLTSASAGGILTPGASPGILGGNNISLNAATTLRMEINGPAAGTQYDQITIEDESPLGGAALDFQLGYTPAVGDSFAIIASAGAGVFDTFAGLPEGAHFTRPGGQIFRITYAGGGGSDVVITRVDDPGTTVASLNIAPGTGPNAGQNVVTIAGGGLAGLTYNVEVSDDLFNWTLQTTATASPAGALNVNFTESPALLRRFYRFSLP